MASREINLWIDERWYNALSKHLKDETLEEQLEDVIDEMCNQLPEHEYKRISEAIWREEQERKQVQEAARRFAVFHVTEDGIRHPSFYSNCFFILKSHLIFKLALVLCQLKGSVFMGFFSNLRNQLLLRPAILQASSNIPLSNIVILTGFDMIWPSTSWRKWGIASIHTKRLR